MASIPFSGQISLGSLRSLAGRNTSSPIGLRDCYGFDGGSPHGGQVPLSLMRGAVQTTDLLNSFNPDALSNCVGIYSTRIINSNYGGAIMNIRRSADSATTNVFSDTRGNMRVSNGETLSNWTTGNGTIQVLTWFDQSSKSNHAQGTVGTGRNAPLLVQDPANVNANVLLFPNSNTATASVYFGYSLSSVSVSSVICSFQTVSKTDIWQSLLCTNADNQGLRYNSLSLNSGDANDFLNPSSSFAITNDVYDATTPFSTITNGVWNNLCAVRGSGSLPIIHMGNVDPTVSSGTLMVRSFHGYMRDMILFGSNLITTTVGSTTTVPEYTQYVSYITSNAWRSGLRGSYLADNWNGTQWIDSSGLGNHASNISGTVTKTSSSLLSGVGGNVILTGTTSTVIRWPTTLMTSSYTFFHVTRYNSTINKLRIFTSSNSGDTNWFSGHWDNKAGLAYHGDTAGFLSAILDTHGTRWVLSSDTANSYRSQGFLRGTVANGAVGTLNINAYNGEASDWAVAAAHIFNRVLSTQEILQVENMLASRYRFPTPIPYGLVLHLDPNDYVGGTTWSDRSGNGFDFTLSTTSIFNNGTSTAPPYMLLSSFATIKRTTDVPIAKYCTFIAWCAPLNSTSDWRTMIRGNVGDHLALIQSGGNALGMYDTETAQFVSSGFNINTLTNVYTKLNMWVFFFSTVAPQWTFYFNPSSLPLTPTATITNTNLAINRSFGTIGTNADGSQSFGKFGSVLWYNRRLSDAELVETYRRYESMYVTPTV